MQVRDVMTREVVTVGPDTSAKYAAELMAGRGFAALPVVDDADRAGGHRRRGRRAPRTGCPPTRGCTCAADEEVPEHPPPLLVRGIMTVGVRTVDAGADVADVARLFIDEQLRSVPVLEHGRLAGIVSRRDLLAALVRPDAEIRQDLLRLVEGYTGELGCWHVTVTEGVATIGRTGVERRRSPPRSRTCAPRPRAHRSRASRASVSSPARRRSRCSADRSEGQA